MEIEKNKRRLLIVCFTSLVIISFLLIHIYQDSGTRISAFSQAQITLNDQLNKLNSQIENDSLLLDSSKIYINKVVAIINGVDTIKYPADAKELLSKINSSQKPGSSVKTKLQKDTVIKSKSNIDTIPKTTLNDIAILLNSKIKNLFISQNINISDDEYDIEISNQYENKIALAYHGFEYKGLFRFNIYTLVSGDNMFTSDQFTESEFSRKKTDLISTLSNLQLQFQQQSNYAQGNNLILCNKRAELLKNISEIENQGTNRFLLLFALPIFGLILLSLMIIPTFYSTDKVISMIFERGLLLQIITVFLLIGTVLILGIGGILQKDVLGTLLGGISVYVLQNRGKNDEPEPPTPIG
jgi:hypothetical protein